MLRNNSQSQDYSKLQDSKYLPQEALDVIKSKEFIETFGEDSPLLKEMANLEKEIGKTAEKNQETLHENAIKKAQKNAKELDERTKATSALIEAYDKFKKEVARLQENSFFLSFLINSKNFSIPEENKEESKFNQDRKTFLRDKGNSILDEMQKAFNSFIEELKKADHFDKDGISLAKTVFEGFTDVTTSNQQNSEAARNALVANMRELNRHFNGMSPAVKTGLEGTGFLFLLAGLNLAFTGLALAVNPSQVLATGLSLLAIGLGLLALAGSIAVTLYRDCGVSAQPATGKMLDFCKMIFPDTQKPKSSPLSRLGSFSGSKKKQEEEKTIITNVPSNLVSPALGGANI